jgi:uncharacterized protein with HEPN domain
MPRNRPGAPEDRIRIQHMMDAARQAIGFTESKTRTSLDTDPMLARALMHAILEIGEAASRTSEVGRSRAPNVPWAQIVGMRNVLIHVYWGVDFDRLWKTVTEELPPLLATLEAATKDWPVAPDA